MLRVSVDNTTPLGYGFERQVDVFFDQQSGVPDRAIRRTGALASRGSRVPRRCAADGPGVSSISKTASAVVDAKVGRGRVLLFGPEVNFRAQSHGTFKFLFNAIYYATAEPATIGAR